MSGYGAYVWSCYALTLAVLLWNVWSARRELRAAVAHARRRLQAQAPDAASARSAPQGEVRS